MPGSGWRARAADVARQRERRDVARAAAASPPLPDVADGGATSGGDVGAFGGASGDDAAMREALEASCSDVCACPFHDADAAAFLARLRRATELSLDDAARAERADAAADAAADENLRAALHASAASASSDDAGGADMLL